MKKILLIIFILISFRLFAQTNVYHPFPDSNAHWTESTWWVVWSTPPCGVHDDYTLFISGDTIIGTYTYHKILKSGYIGAPPCQPPGYYYYNNYAGAFRQDTALKKVYFNNGSGEQLLYDFKLNIGDTLPQSYNYGSGSSVKGIDSVLVGNQYHKRFLLHLFDNSFPQQDTSTLVEGIGSTFGLYNHIYTPFESGSQLHCFGHNGEYYPANSNCTFATAIDESKNLKLDIEISPNPSSGIFTINSSEKFQYSVYDIFGREVFQSTTLNQNATLDLTSYPKGIYFVIGKVNDKMFSRKIILQ